jgi:NADH-quinone oxidoreductase subunit G
MPKLTIEGKPVTVPAGSTILQAAEKLGVDIPTFCYHPNLTIAGNCRMCLVEVEGQGKPVTACSTPVTEGMAVKVNSSGAQEARRGVIEFLLTNHPLDCPICDKSGECVLQDNSMAHGKLKSRFTFAKSHKAKAKDIGKHIVLDAERCIMCTRCVRFLDEVTKTRELGIFGRGNHEELGLAPGKRLDSAYSGCVTDLCPVGALTLKEFRFQSRVWFLGKTESICQSCARGCNITVESNLNAVNKTGARRVYRLMPRENPRVNKSWMCDEGRLRFRFVDERRLMVPVRRVDGKENAASWDSALDTFAAILRKARPGRTGFLLSRSSSVEDLFLAQDFLARHLKGAVVAVDTPPNRLPTSDRFLMRMDKHANTAGSVALGIKSSRRDWINLLKKTSEGRIDTLVVVGHEITQLHPGAIQARRRIRELVVISPNEGVTPSMATLVLPTAVFAERDGVVVNCDNRAQLFRKAFEPLGQARPEWTIWRDLLGRFGTPRLLRSGEAVFRAVADRVPPFRGLDYEKLGSAGVKLKGGR